MTIAAPLSNAFEGLNRMIEILPVTKQNMGRFQSNAEFSEVVTFMSGKSQSSLQ
jgi:hypothetical protein